MIEQVNRDATIPAEASADGKRNSWIVHCDVVQHAKAYCVCIHLCKQRKEGRLPTQYADCSAAIGKKECPALKMRKEELAEGHAIYFRERPTIGVISEAKAQSLFVPSANSPVTKPTPVAAKPAPVSSKGRGSVLDRIDDGGYAKAISRAIENELKPKAVAPAPKVENVATIPGESLLDMARRLMGK